MGSGLTESSHGIAPYSWSLSGVLKLAVRIQEAVSRMTESTDTGIRHLGLNPSSAACEPSDLRKII